MVYIEGQAGQGKSTLAVQYLAGLGAPFGWYQVGPEDQDPVFLSMALLRAFKNLLPEFSSPLAERMFESGEVAAKDIRTLAAIVARDLAGQLRFDLHLALDDLHLLEDSPASLSFLTEFLARAPARLRFVLISRSAPPAAWKTTGHDAVHIGNDELALDKTEIAMLYGEVLHIPLSLRDVNSLHAATEGWIAGVLLAGSSLPSKQGCGLTSQVLLQKRGVLDFFTSDIFAGLPDNLKSTLLKLSLLEEIPLALAKRLSDQSDICAVLEMLRRRNFFIRGVDEQGTVLVFHALFREFLQHQAREQLGLAEIRNTLRQAGDHFLEQGDAIKALRHLLQAGEFQAGEKILRQAGMTLVATNRIVTLKGFMDRIPDEVVRNSSWLLFFVGVVRLDTDPFTAFPYLDEARARFVREHDELGEILAIAQQVQYHLAVDGRHNLGRSFLPRAEELFTKRSQQLTVPVQVQLALAIASGYCFFESDMERTDQYAGIALELAVMHRLDNLVASVRVIRCCRHTFTGDWKALRTELENSLALLHNLRVSTINKTYLVMAQMSALALTGDFANYQRQKKRLLLLVAGDQVNRSFVESFLLVYDINHALCDGRFNDAFELAKQGLASGRGASSAHMCSRLLHLFAYACSLLGRDDEARAAAEESRTLREAAGGPRFIVLNEVFHGATLTRMGEYAEGEQMLASAIAGSRHLGESYLGCAARLHRAYLRIKGGRSAQARGDVERALAAMSKNSFQGFLSCVPAILRETLCFAVRSGIEIPFAQKLARHRLEIAIESSGREVALLKIRSLGQLTLSLGTAQPVRAQELSQAQRQLLALLLSAPGLRMGQEEVQAYLWPESTPEKSRRNFDTLILRLRKTIDSHFGLNLAKEYIVVQKGLVSLENCRLDAEEFARLARKGLRLSRKKQFWQAGNALHRAFALWQGGYLKGIAAENELATPRRHELDRLYLEASASWGRILAEGRELDQAIEVVAAALHYDPLCHELVKLLYNLQAAAGSPANAAKVLRQYRRVLEKEEYAPEEIEGIIGSLWATSS